MAIAGTVLSSLGLALWGAALASGGPGGVWEGLKEGARGNTVLSTDKLTLRAPSQPPFRIPLQPTGPTQAARVWKDNVSALDQGDVPRGEHRMRLVQ